MSISNYTELQAAITNYGKLAGGEDYSTRIKEWVSIAEAEINRKLRVFSQQKLQTIDYGTSNTTRRLPLPTGFVEMLSVAARLSTEADTQYEKVRYSAPAQLVGARLSATTGKPELYTIRRNGMEFERLPDATYKIRLHFVGRWDIASDTTNWLLTHHPDVYLYGALANSALYRWNDPRMNQWRQLFTNVINQINEVDERTRDDGELDVSEIGEVALGGPSRYNINVG